MPSNHSPRISRESEVRARSPICRFIRQPCGRERPGAPGRGVSWPSASHQALQTSCGSLQIPWTPGSMGWLGPTEYPRDHDQDSRSQKYVTVLGIARREWTHTLISCQESFLQGRLQI